LRFPLNESQFFIILLAIALSTSAFPALAGPPFLTDDPEPVEYKHWEIYGFSTATFLHGQSSGVLPGFEMNYGAFPDLQLHIIAPISFVRDRPTGNRFGFGDTQFGVKYRFLNPAGGDSWPQIGTFPMLVVPTGNSDRGLGSGRTHVFLPVWLQWDIGKWTTYGGGGYWINPGPGNRNYWFTGWQVQRKVMENLAIGGEVFGQSASTTDGPGADASAGFNLGGIYDVTERDHFLVSAGRGLMNARTTNEFSYYVAYLVTF
jgi:hypothetical protein